MLHDARMAGLAKLRRSIRSTDERQLWAVLTIADARIQFIAAKCVRCSIW
jgi:hypothetical protein